MRDRIRKRAESRRNLGGLDTLELPEGVELYKPEKGPVEFDILPYVVSVDNHPEVKKGEQWYQRNYLAHRNVGPEEKFLICPRTIGKRCPICEEHQKLKKDPNAEEEVVDALRAKERELFNVVMKDGDGSVMVLDISTFLFGRKLEEEIREGDEANAAFAELSGGKTLKVRWESKSMGTSKFVEAGRIDFVDREDIDPSALEAVVDLDKAMKILSYEEIDKIFQAGGDEVPEDTDDTPAEEAPARRVIGKAKPKAEPEEEEDQIPGLEMPAKKKKGETELPDCTACEGTGKTTKGKTCPICGGSGKDEDVPAEEPAAEEPAEEEEEEKPVARRVIGKPAAKEEAPAGRRVIRRG
jgi:uncharacterized Zn finger protein (UPF0148 family)